MWLTDQLVKTCIVQTGFARGRSRCRCLTSQSLSSVLSMRSRRRRRCWLLPQVVILHQLWLNVHQRCQSVTVSPATNQHIRPHDPVAFIPLRWPTHSHISPNPPLLFSFPLYASLSLSLPSPSRPLPFCCGYGHYSHNKRGADGKLGG